MEPTQGMANRLIEPLRTGFASCWRALPRLPGHKPASTAANYAFLGLGCDPLATVRMRLGHRMKVDLRSWTERYAYYSGIYQDEELIRTARRLLPQDAVVLDVGANIGFFTVPLARALADRRGTLHAFEPLPSNFARLEENLRLNDLPDGVVQRWPCGLSSECTELEITLREDFQRGGETGNASIVIDDGLDARFKRIKVPVRTLDDFAAEHALDRLDFVKIDIEGHEDLFFEGGRSTLARTRPTILMEVNAPYFRRRGVVLAERLAELLPPDYRFARRTDAWHAIDDVGECDEIDDALLVPAERLGATLDTLNR